jgi:hypothetical protein
LPKKSNRETCKAQPDTQTEMLRKLVLLCALAAVAAQSAPGNVGKPMFPTLSPALTNPNMALLQSASAGSASPAATPGKPFYGARGLRRAALPAAPCCAARTSRTRTSPSPGPEALLPFAPPPPPTQLPPPVADPFMWGMMWPMMWYMPYMWYYPYYSMWWMWNPMMWW